MRSIHIDGRRIGPGAPVCIIAEVGVNHNGDLELAKRLVREAKRQGADCVKFQTFRAAGVATSSAQKANYQKRLTDPEESQVEMLRKLEFGKEDFAELIRLCREEDVLFLSTPYGFEDADLLDELGAPGFKIASGQAVELPFLEYVARKGKPVLLSTGMCDLDEVATAVSTIRRTPNEQLVVLQCTTDYPAAIEEVNIRAMVTMGQRLECLVGYSDHTESLSASLAAVALGACVLERHFTLDRSLPGPDHKSSLEPEEFGEMVRLARQTEVCLGDGVKRPSARELENLPQMRRSLVAARNVRAGERLDWSNMCFKRPAGGLCGKAAQGVVGRRAAVDIPADARIVLEQLA